MWDSVKSGELAKSISAAATAHKREGKGRNADDLCALFPSLFDQSSVEGSSI